MNRETLEHSDPKGCLIKLLHSSQGSDEAGRLKEPKVWGDCEEAELLWVSFPLLLLFIADEQGKEQ